MAVCSHARPDMAIYGHAWPCRAMHGQTWPYTAIYGHAWPYMAMIYGTLWMRSSFRFCLRCAKLRENPENQGFMFFGFLPPYFGVSDSLVYFKRRGLKRSIVWYKKLLISCLVARYSAVFVFKSMEVHGNSWESMEIGIGMGVFLSARSFV